MSKTLTPDAGIAARVAVMARRLAIPLVLLPLAACGVDRAVTGSITPDDYRERHPIKLQEGPVGLDVYAAGAKMDAASFARVKQFGQNYRKDGAGQIEALLPQGAMNDAEQRAALPALRKALASGGASGYLSIGSYPATDPHAASPIKLSYRALRAHVDSRCGQWPADLASGSTVEGWDNRPYWNMGCSYQTMYASQVADPRDLVEPRAETPPDTQMRSRAIDKIRQGTDPSTTWAVKNSAIGTVGN